jgi:hypothetical protein
VAPVTTNPACKVYGETIGQIHYAILGVLGQFFKNLKLVREISAIADMIHMTNQK